MVTGDFQHHACGCFSALSAVKKQHRAAENRLLCAERLSVLASSLTGLPYPGNTLRAAWQDVLFCQFHDVLCGCAVKAAYDDVFHFLGEAQAVAARAANSAAQKISWAIDTVEGRGFPLSKDSDWAVWEQEELGTPLVVFNLNGFDQRSYVRVNKALTSVKDEEGREVPVQRTRSACSNCDPSIFRDGTFLAEVPALGYRVYRVFLQREPEEQLDGPAILTGEGRMENPWWVLELDPREGGIRSLWDKENGREVFDGPAAGALVIADSDTTTWSHRKYVFDEELGRFSGARLTVLENGP